MGEQISNSSPFIQPMQTLKEITMITKGNGVLK